MHQIILISRSFRVLCGYEDEIVPVILVPTKFRNGSGYKIESCEMPRRNAEKNSQVHCSTQNNSQSKKFRANFLSQKEKRLNYSAIHILASKCLYTKALQFFCSICLSTEVLTLCHYKQLIISIEYGLIVQ